MGLDTILQELDSKHPPAIKKGNKVYVIEPHKPSPDKQREEYRIEKHEGKIYKRRVGGNLLILIGESEGWKQQQTK